MSTYRQLTYLILDEIKVSSDDSTITEDHVIFLLDKYRSLILKQLYKDIKKEISESNYQMLCLDLEPVDSLVADPCDSPVYLRTTKPIPVLLQIGNPKVYTTDYYKSALIEYIPRERMQFVGYNKYLQNIIYVSLNPDGHLYLKSNNPQYLYLEKIKMTGIFQDPSAAAELACDYTCEVLDREYPLEEALVPQVVELIVKELLGVNYRVTDDTNNSRDDLPQEADPNNKANNAQYTNNIT